MDNNALKLADGDFDYIYDPEHKKHPGGGWRKTEKGWAKGQKDNGDKKNETHDDALHEVEHQSITFTNPGKGDASYGLHKVQLTPDTVIYADGYSKKYGEMSKEEQEAVQRDVQVIGSFSQKGFSNYNDVSVETFHSNMKHQLDSIANNNIREIHNESTEKVDSKSVEHFKQSLNAGFEALKAKYAPAVRSKAAANALENYEKKLCSVVEECVRDGSLGDVTEEQLDSFLQEDMKRLLYQELETRRRSMGDHGIRHLVGNAVNTVDILEQLKQGGITKGTTGKDKLMGMICQVNHDIGYTLGTVATNAADGTFHKTHSGTIAAAERDRYAKLLGEDGADMLVGKYDCYEGTNLPKHFDKDKNLIPKEEVYNEDGTPKSSSQAFMRSKTKHIQKGAIQYHDDADYDWQNNAFRSAIALADCTALFGKDKVQEFFLEDNVAMENVAKMHTIMNAPDETFVGKKEQKGKSPEEIKAIADGVRQKLFDGFKKTMHKRIDSLAASLLDKDMLKSQVSEMTIGKFSTVEDILTRSSGELQGFNYHPESNTMQVSTRYSQEGKLLEDMFGSDLVRKQWNKMADGDLHITQSDIVNGEQKTSYGVEGKDRIVVNIGGMDDIRIQNAGVKKAYEKLAPRLIIQKLAILRKNEEIGGKEAAQKFKQQVEELDKPSNNGKKRSKGEEIFGSQWNTLKKLLQRGAYGQLARFPMTETERAYLMGAFRSAKIARSIVASIGRLDRIARRAVMGWINTFSYSVEKSIVQYKTDGEVSVLFDESNGRQTLYKTHLGMDGKEGLMFINKLISSQKELLKTNPKKWMQLVSKNWTRKY